MIVKDHLLVSFGGQPEEVELAHKCRRALIKRFCLPIDAVKVIKRQGCAGVHISMEADGPDSCASDQRTFAEYFQFAAGWWYARTRFE